MDILGEYGIPKLSNLSNTSHENEILSQVATFENASVDVEPVLFLYGLYAEDHA